MIGKENTPYEGDPQSPVRPELTLWEEECRKPKYFRLSFGRVELQLLWILGRLLLLLQREPEYPGSRRHDARRPLAEEVDALHEVAHPAAQGLPRLVRRLLQRENTSPGSVWTEKQKSLDCGCAFHRRVLKPETT